jgi:putative addiction module killer protein
VTIREYIENDQSPFSKWFNKLDPISAAKITTSLYRLDQGNYSNTKGVGEGVLECRIDFGPGYRIYFGKDGIDIIILLGGGTKKQQSKDIDLAKKKWHTYKKNKD